LQPKKDHIEKIIIENFSYIGDIKKIETINHNDINSKNFLISSKKSKYVLKFLKNNQQKRNKQIQRILYKANQNGIKVAIPIKNESKRKIPDDVILSKFYNGKTFSGSVQELESFAYELAKLHKFLKKSRVILQEDANIQTYEVLSPKEITKIKRKIGQKSNPNKIDNMIKRRLEFLQQINKIHSEFKRKRKKIGEQLIHNDLHTDNIIFFKKNISVVLDFYFMKRGTILEDVSYSALRLSEQTGKNFKNVEKMVNLFINTYSKYNKINQNELLNFNYFLSKNSLARINHILRNRYFHNSNSWVQQLPLHFKLLDFSYKIKLEV
jgi:Ser/Thr protein kinase RdoA (MazF antagonist)